MQANNKYKIGASKHFALPSDDEEFEEIERKAGGYQLYHIRDVENYFVSFDFVDTSLIKSKHCFNGAALSTYDFIKLFELFKYLSGKPISEALTKNIKNFDIKPITNVSSSAYKENVMRVLNMKAWNEDDTPLIYQGRLYNTDECVLPEKAKAPRVYFVLGLEGCLSFILIDLFHEFFPTADRSST